MTFLQISLVLALRVLYGRQLHDECHTGALCVRVTVECTSTMTLESAAGASRERAGLRQTLVVILSK